MVCLDLAHSKILLTTWKEMSKTNFLAVFPKPKQEGYLIIWMMKKTLIDFDWHKNEFKTNIIQIQMKCGR